MKKNIILVIIITLVMIISSYIIVFFVANVKTQDIIDAYGNITRYESGYVSSIMWFIPMIAISPIIVILIIGIIKKKKSLYIIPIIASIYLLNYSSNLLTKYRSYSTENTELDFAQEKLDIHFPNGYTAILKENISQRNKSMEIIYEASIRIPQNAASREMIKNSNWNKYRKTFESHPDYFKDHLSANFKNDIKDANMFQDWLSPDNYFIFIAYYEQYDLIYLTKVKVIYNK